MEKYCSLCNKAANSICGRCHQVNYCSTVCQRSDWPNHKKICKPIQVPVASPVPAATAFSFPTSSGTTKVLLRRAPRYAKEPQLPPEKALDLAQRQLELQRERSQILECALNNKFSLVQSKMKRFVPVSYDVKSSDPAPPLDSLQASDAYQVTLTLPNGKKYEDDFKFDGYEAPNHSKGKHRTACSSAQSVDMMMATDIRYREGGLHYIIEDGRMFWGIIICWLAFGTAFPYGPCWCVDQDKSWMAKLQKEWNAKLEEAKKDPCSVQCMFYDAPLGCLNAACPFKHSTS